MLKITLNQDPYNQGAPLYSLDFLVIHPGLSFLIGCNGSGKTTLLNNVSEVLQDDPSVQLVHLPELVTSAETASVGEVNSQLLLQFRKDLSDRVNAASKGDQIVVLGDLSHVGLTADTISAFRNDLNVHIIPDAESSQVDLYILIAVTDFEYLLDQQSIDVQTFSVLRFNNYTSYKKYMMNSRAALDKRYKKIKK